MLVAMNKFNTINVESLCEKCIGAEWCVMKVNDIQKMKYFQI